MAKQYTEDIVKPVGTYPAAVCTRTLAVTALATTPTFERDTSPDDIRHKTSAATPIARILLVSDWVEAAAVARSSSTIPAEEEAGTATRACKRRREDDANALAYKSRAHINEKVSC